MIWWYWVILGLLLAALELITPGGFFFLFLGVAAVLVGILAALQLSGPAVTEWVIFSIAAMACVLFFRKPLLRHMEAGTARHADIDSLRGEVAVAMDDMPAGGMGRAQLRGTVWSARNTGNEPIAPGDRCTVVALNGLTIMIAREGAY
jgi:membrane protein implicated in regulation of membrane protease activity